MELFGLDNKFNIVCQLVPSSLQWNRRYYTFGDFSLRIDSSQYDEQIAYVFSNGRKELGLVQKVEWKSDENGETLDLSGFFAEKLLDDAVIYPTYYADGSLVDVVKTMCMVYANLNLKYVFSEPISDKVMFQTTGSQLGTKLFDILSQHEASMRLYYDISDLQMKLELYRGKNRVQGNPNRLNYVRFSTAWDNLHEPNVLVDESDYRNYAIVGGQGEGANRTYVEVDQSNGQKKKKIFIDSRNSQYDSSKQTWQQYLDGLKQEGIEELNNHKKIVNVDFSPITDGYVYMTDYDLGDMCECYIEPIGVEVQGRIVEIHETYENGVMNIELELGDQIISKINKLERGIYK